MQSALALSATWDERPVHDAYMNDVDDGLVRRVLDEDERTRGADPESFLRTMRLLTDDGLSLAGLLCYGRTPEQRLPQATVVAVRHAGVLAGDSLRDRKDFGGPLRGQFDGAFEFVRTQAPRPRQFAGSGSEERALPDEAVRHALVNALVHRDYDLASNVRVEVFDDRVEIASPGRLLNSVTVEAMHMGIHVLRNPRTYLEMARMNLVTNAGFGVSRMGQVMREAGMPMPEISSVAADVRVVLRLTPSGGEA